MSCPPGPGVTIKLTSQFHFSEAVETRHALHGVTWPSSNPKCLNVDFGLGEDMEKAIMSTLEEMPRIQITTENRDVKDEKEFGWSKDPYKNSSTDDRRVSWIGSMSWNCVIEIFLRAFRAQTDLSANGMSGRRTRKSSSAMTETAAAVNDARRKNDPRKDAAPAVHQVHRPFRTFLSNFYNFHTFQDAKPTRSKGKLSQFVCSMICSERPRRLLASTGCRYQLNK